MGTQWARLCSESENRRLLVVPMTAEPATEMTPALACRINAFREYDGAKLNKTLAE
jgi:hypothetical protein